MYGTNIEADWIRGILIELYFINHYRKICPSKTIDYLMNGTKYGADFRIVETNRFIEVKQDDTIPCSNNIMF